MIRWWNAGRYERECAADRCCNHWLREYLAGERYYRVVVPRAPVVIPPDPFEEWALRVVDEQGRDPVLVSMVEWSNGVFSL